jgi:hypothetical protein
MGRFNVLRLANHTNRTLSSLLIHDPVTERGSHFFKGLLLGFPGQRVLASQLYLYTSLSLFVSDEASRTEIGQELTGSKSKRSPRRMQSRLQRRSSSSHECWQKHWVQPR